MSCGPGERTADRPSAPASDSSPAAGNSRRRAGSGDDRGCPGSNIEGEVRLTELEGNFPTPGVRIQARITGPPEAFAPGRHGFHIHENAKGGCVPPFTSAGGHFDAGPAGNPDPDVNHPYHTGDIPNLMVDSTASGPSMLRPAGSHSRRVL